MDVPADIRPSARHVRESLIRPMSPPTPGHVSEATLEHEALHGLAHNKTTQPTLKSVINILP